MLSIVVPTRNEEDSIGELLESIKENNFSNYEVIIVDGGSTDRTKDIVDTYKKTSLIEGPQEGPAVARNVGWKEAKGDIICFLDADWYLEDNSLKKIDKFFRENSEKDVGGFETVFAADTIVGKALKAENSANFFKNTVYSFVSKLMWWN